MHMVIVDARCGSYLCNFAQNDISRARGSADAYRISEAAENQQNDNDEENQPQPSGREIAPLPTVRAPWQHPHERQH